MAAHDAQVVSDAAAVYGYESPSEDAQPGFFLPTPCSPSPHTHIATQIAPSAPVLRPSMASQPSYIAAARLRVPNPAAGLDDIVSKAENGLPGGKVTFRDRIACYQWTYFTMTMATGGVANVLHALFYNPAWVTAIGTFFFILNIVLFLLNCTLLSWRFIIRPGSFLNSFTDQVESLFIPAFFVSIATILINICEYGVPHCGVWLLLTMEVMFWIYVVLSVVASAGLYLILWSTLVFPVHMMTPTWVFPAYPLLLTAPFAANIINAAIVSGHRHSINSTAVALCAAATQGTGCLIAFMISAAFIYRLMTQKLPRDMQRPGVFISIGPFGFTAAGIAQLGYQAEAIIPPDFLATPIAAPCIKVVSILVALWLWGLSMWFFLVSVGSLWKYVGPNHKMPFQMTWWSFVFPNTAMVSATQVMGSIFDSTGLHIFSAVMVVLLIVVWIGIFIAMLRSFRARKLMWPKNAA